MDKSQKYNSIGRIILVDRDIQMLQMLEMILGRSYQVATARSGEEARDLMSSEEPFHVVMASFNLPGMNGLEFLLRVNKIFPSTVRILMTSRFEDKNGINEAISEGWISRIVSKPFCMTTLLEQLNNDLAPFTYDETTSCTPLIQITEAAQLSGNAGEPQHLVQQFKL